MPDHIKRIADLIIKHLKEALSPEEKLELQDWIDFSPTNRQWFEEATDEEQVIADLVLYEQAATRKEELRSRALRGDKADMIPWRPLMAAAVILGLIVGTIIWKSPFTKSPAPPKVVYAEDVPPGGEKAILTLGDGTVMTLDSTKNGPIARQGNMQIVKQTGGLLSYERMSGASTGASYNTLTTPRGGTYGLILPDGSKVWLNAGSSLRFPTPFTGEERRVELTGEAYFEVARNKTAPFRVAVGSMDVEVLGTRFDIMAYADEPLIQASLLEGAVKVTSSLGGITLKPGQQAGYAAGSAFQITGNVDMDEVVAWKNGLFEFRKSDIESVMRQIARWYDVQVVYEGKKTSHSFSGIISRDNNASDVLRILELSDVHFQIRGRTIVVMP